MKDLDNHWLSREDNPSIAHMERRAVRAAEKYAFIAELFDHTEYVKTKAKDFGITDQPFIEFMAFLAILLPEANRAADLAEDEFRQHPDYGRIVF